MCRNSDEGERKTKGVATRQVARQWRSNEAGKGRLGWARYAERQTRKRDGWEARCGPRGDCVGITDSDTSLSESVPQEGVCKRLLPCCIMIVTEDQNLNA